MPKNDQIALTHFSRKTGKVVQKKGRQEDRRRQKKAVGPFRKVNEDKRGGGEKSPRKKNRRGKLGKLSEKSDKLRRVDFLVGKGQSEKKTRLEQIFSGDETNVEAKTISSGFSGFWEDRQCLILE